MDRLIPLVNRVQDALGQFENHEGISFPRLVVVGSQSSGKSSVLESLVGRDFLPRGSGIVTRRPLILQLEFKAGSQAYGQFDHKPGKNFTDFIEIRREIEQETIRTVGKKQAISDAPIRLRIISSDVLDITLVDLPGLTKVAVGDQPQNISEQIRAMVLSYISDENSLILAVSAANQDIANSDSLKIAHEVDPTGMRTIGVVTKIDIMDKGTDALSVLTGQLYPLALGYIGVICRSQEDINRNKPMANHLEDERNFFERHEKYKAISQKMGTKYLAACLNNFLKKHIIKTLPMFKKRLNDLIRDADSQLKIYGMPIGGNRDFQGVVILNIITAFSNMYSKILDGKNCSVTVTELSGGAQIRYMLFRKYLKNVSSVDPFVGLTEQDIRTAILKSRGLKSNYMIPQEALELLIKAQIIKLRPFAIEALSEVLEYLKRFIREIQLNEYIVYPNLQSTILHIADNVLDSCYKPALEFINDCFENELAFINLDHPMLISYDDAKQKVDTEFNDSIKAKILENNIQQSGWFRRNVSKAPEIGNEKDTKDMLFAKEVVISYFGLIKKNTSDYVIKAIMTFQVGKSIDKLQTELLAQVYCKDKFEDVLLESPEIPQKRQAAIDLLGSLRKASTILDEIRDIDS